MSKTLVTLPQITPPATINSNAALLTNIQRLKALNPKEVLAISRYCRQKELANDTSSPITTYDPATALGNIKLTQDAKAVFGNIPTGDLMYAALAIDIANCKAVYSALPLDADSLRALVANNTAVEPEDQLRRECLYLRLEIGE